MRPHSMSGASQAPAQHPSQATPAEAKPPRRICTNDYYEPIYPGATLHRRVRCTREMRTVIRSSGVWFRCDHCDPLVKQT